MPLHRKSKVNDDPSYFRSCQVRYCCTPHSEKTLAPPFPLWVSYVCYCRGRGPNMNDEGTGPILSQLRVCSRVTGGLNTVETKRSEYAPSPSSLHKSITTYSKLGAVERWKIDHPVRRSGSLIGAIRRGSVVRTGTETKSRSSQLTRRSCCCTVDAGGVGVR